MLTEDVKVVYVRLEMANDNDDSAAVTQKLREVAKEMGVNITTVKLRSFAVHVYGTKVVS